MPSHLPSESSGPQCPVRARGPHEPLGSQLQPVWLPSAQPLMAVRVFGHWSLQVQESEVEEGRGRDRGRLWGLAYAGGLRQALPLVSAFSRPSAMMVHRLGCPKPSVQEPGPPELDLERKEASLPALSLPTAGFWPCPLVLTQPPSGSLCCGPAPAGCGPSRRGCLSVQRQGLGEKCMRARLEFLNFWDGLRSQVPAGLCQRL